MQMAIQQAAANLVNGTEPASGLNKVNNMVQGNVSGSFLKVLSSTLMIPAATIPKDQTNASGLSSGLQLLMAALPKGAPFFQKDALQTKDAKQVLSLLSPLEKKELIKQFESEDMPQANQLNAQNPILVLAALINMNWIQQNFPAGAQAGLDKIKTGLAKVFPALEKEMAPENKISNVLDMFVKECGQKENNSSKPETQSFLKAVQSVLESKKSSAVEYAEKAFQKPLVKLSSTNTTRETTFSTGFMPQAEQLRLRLPITGGEGEKTQFVRDLQDILSQGKLITADNGTSKLQIRLSPENLGNLNIELIHKNGEITAKIIASSQTAKDVLDTHLSSLKSAFASQNIGMEKVEVFLDSKDSPFFRQGGQGSSHQGQQQAQQQKKSDGSEPSSFTDLLELEAINEKV